MFRPLAPSHRRPPRRGTSILLIALIMLTLFSVVGLTFAFYALREGRLANERKFSHGASATPQPSPPDPTVTLNLALSSLVYGVPFYNVPDERPYLSNALRGHDMARSMYGGLYDPAAPNTTPFAGVGIFHQDVSAYTDPNPFPSLVALPPAERDRARFVNHTLGVLDGRPFLLDPEWTGHRTAGGGWPANFAASQAGRAYVSKAAPYSHPDLKNFFLAQIDPATGAVLVPSFHREWLFGPLAPSNPNWNTPTGRYLTLRPRPLEHPNFPRVGPDADGVYRGDVKNLHGAPGGNDSIWIDIGAPVMTTADGRKFKPLVAILVLPLNGRFDLSVHGNNYASGGVHASGQGWGPWEVNIRRAFVPGAVGDAERQAVVNYRGVPRARNGLLTSRAFDPYAAGPLPAYAPVAWNATPTSMFLPHRTNPLLGIPEFVGYQDGTVAEPNHPSLFNPAEYSHTLSAFNNRVFPLGDLKRMSLRYAFTPEWYAQAELSIVAPFSFKGDPGSNPADPNFVVSPDRTKAHRWRIDPAHVNRLLVTPYARVLDRPGIVPNFANQDARTALALIPAVSPILSPKPGLLTPDPYPAPGATGPVTDFAAPDRWTNARAALGSVNVNRPLADYRNDTTAPLSAGNLGNAAVAEADRQALARDIFIRLVAATGAAGYIDTDATGAARITLPDPTTFVLTTPGGGTVNYTQQQYDALRYLAQLAANIVDYRDNDDISTVFVWNPSTAGPAADLTPTEIGRRAVIGFEKPRLVLNEVYGELVNDPRDPVTGPPDGNGVPQAPQQPGQAKFWAELVNHSPTLNPAGPLGTGAVSLGGYQIEITRANRVTGVGAPQDWASYLSNQANTPGGFDPALGAPDAVFALPAGANAVSVAPNNGTYAPNVATLPTGGIALVGAPAAAKMGSEEFHQPNPLPAGSVWATKIESAAPGNPNALGYTFPLPTDANIATLSSREFKRHVALLRRPANRYLPVGPTNPLVTDDTMDFIPAFDAVHRVSNQGTNRGARDPVNAPNGYDPVAERFSVGKVQPLASLSAATVTEGAGRYNVYNNNATFAVPSELRDSMVRDQTTVQPAPNTEKAPKNTFGRHNGNAGPPGNTTVVAGAPATLGDTVMTPADWLVHLDRPLVNQIELFQVRDSRPHLATREFAVPTPTLAPGVFYEAGYARWRHLGDGLARALELLSVGSRVYGEAHGGRLAGRISIGDVQDQRVLSGLLDPPGTPGFDAAFVETNLWPTNPSAASWIGTRSTLQQRTLPNGSTTAMIPVPGASVHDTNTGGDRPFFSFGGPASPPNSTFAYGTGPQDGLLRTPAQAAGTPPPQPYLYLGSTSPVPPHSYAQTEALRKIMNNTTYASQTFVVYTTIGYFKVENEFPTAPAGWPAGVPVPPTLGPEEFTTVPGDLRQQFVAVVDLSNMALKAVVAPGDTNLHADVHPFFTSLEATARPGAGGTAQLSLAYSSYNPGSQTLFVAADGQEIAISAAAPNNVLVLGYGVEQQVVTVASVDGVTADGRGGLVTVTPVNGVFRTAWAGSCVSNVRPGYPGPQPGFNYTSNTYKSVVPYVERIR